MPSSAIRPLCGLAARHSLSLAAQRVRRPEQRIEGRLTSNCGTNYRTDCGTNYGTNPTTSRPRVSLVPVRDFASRRFSTSLPQPSHRLSGVRSEFALWFALRFVLWFVLRYALWFAVPALGMSGFADGGAGFRRSCVFDISTTSNSGRSGALRAARTSRVVVARRRRPRLARRPGLPVALAVAGANPACADGTGSGRLE
jgi:hypothetical protein